MSMSSAAGIDLTARPDMSVAAILAAMPPRLSRLAHHWAQETPSAPAVLLDNRTVSYGELWRSVERARRLLRKAGIRGGDRVLVVNETSIATIVLLLALSELDAWPCLVNARVAFPELQSFASLTSARLSIYTIGASPAAREHATHEPMRTVADDTFGTIAFGPLNTNATPEPVEADKAKQVGAVLFTSGTTGKSKAVMLSHQAVMYMGATMAIYRGVRPSDCFYIVVPMGHVIGLGAALMAALWAGASVEPVARFDAGHLARALAGGRVSHLLGVPTMYRKLLDYGAEQGLNMRSPRLSMVGSGGSPLDLALKRDVEAALGQTLRNSYGMTEHNPVARTLEGADDDAIGEVQPGVELRLVDTENHERDVGLDEAGEIWVRGPSRMLGYYRDPEATRAALRGDGWFATGDLGRRDARGRIYIVGRSKDMIIRNGFNVYPAEIEAVINEQPGVAQSAVIGVAREANEDIHAYVQRTPGAHVDVDALKRLLRERLTAYKQPSVIRVVDELPLGPTGKILKRELRAQAQARA